MRKFHIAEFLVQQKSAAETPHCVSGERPRSFELTAACRVRHSPAQYLPIKTTRNSFILDALKEFFMRLMKAFHWENLSRDS